MVAGNTLVVGRGLDVERGAVLEIAGGDHDVGLARAVRRALQVVRGGFFFAVFLDWLHVEMLFRQASENVRKLGVHLVDIFLVEIENLLAGMGMKCGIGLDRGVEAL